MILEFLSKYLGYIAGGLTTIAFFPQVLKVWSSKSASDISLSMIIIFTTGVTLWLVYGIIISNFSLIIANAITLIFSISILVAKLIYK
tara:strand:- start:712 stop:975 length:264 start_codon:yes stop_codon:yes gene_type:complete